MSSNEAGPRLVLVRHGQTDSNVRRALDSRPPGAPLNALGREQAERVADRLAGEPVVAVYASVAVRARETAAPIAARHGLAVEVVADLQEVFCGDFEGSADHDARMMFDGIYRRWVGGELDLRMPGGESAAEVRDRMLPVLAGLWRRHLPAEGAAPGAVVVVSHGGAIQHAARAMIDDYRTSRYVPNTGRVELECTSRRADGDPAGWRLARWEDAADAGVPDPRGDVTGGEHEPESVR